MVWPAAEKKRRKKTKQFAIHLITNTQAKLATQCSEWKLQQCAVMVGSFKRDQFVTGKGETTSDCCSRCSDLDYFVSNVYVT